MSPFDLMPLMMSWLAMTQVNADNFFSSVGKSIVKETTAVKQPIVQTITYIGSSQCQNVKKLLGVQYEQVEGEKEPDYSNLALDYISNEVSVSFNLSSAARLIPEARGTSYRPLIIFLHGFTDDPTKDSFTTIRNAFVKAGTHDVLALDASSLIRWLYLRASTYVRFIGRQLGEVLAAMVSVGVEPESIHMIGHSLGAHIAGFASKYFRNITGVDVGRLSGLDPAGPCFSDLPDSLRISPYDAAFVDVIHTDAGVFGLDEPVGQVDFYPNGGSQQPNCLFESCSHSRVWELYSESVVTQQAFIGVQCDDWEDFRKGNCTNNTSIMGYGCEPGTQGRYYLQTNESSPYGLGLNGVRYVNNEGLVANVGSAIKSLFG